MWPIGWVVPPSSLFTKCTLVGVLASVSIEKMASVFVCRRRFRSYLEGFGYIIEGGLRNHLSCPACTRVLIGVSFIGTSIQTPGRLSIFVLFSSFLAVRGLCVGCVVLLLCDSFSVLFLIDFG